MYADCVTPSMERAISETNRRRAIQQSYNEAPGIVPKTIIKDVYDVLEISSRHKDADKNFRKMTRFEREQVIKQLTADMRAAAKMLEFEHAAYLRDKIEKLRTMK